MNTKENIVKISAAKPARVKSRETFLKQTLRGLNKELLSIDKMFMEHKELSKKVDAAKERATTLNAKTKEVKAELIKELGLE